MQRKRHNRSGTLSQDLRQLWGYLSPRRQWQLGVLLLLLILTALSEMTSVGAIFPFLTALDNAESLLNNPHLQPGITLLQVKTTQQLVTWLGMIFIGVVLLANGLRLVTLHIRTRLAAAIGADISSQVYCNTLRQPYNFHVTQNSSDLIQTLTADVESLTSGVLLPFLVLVSNALLIPALVVMLLLVDGKIALGTAILLGGTYVIIYRTRQHLLKRNSKILAYSNQQKIQVVQEGIGGIRDVLLGNSQHFFEQIYLRHESALRQAKATNLTVSQSPAYVIEALALSAIVLLALSLGQSGDFSRVIPVLGSLALGAKRLLPAFQFVFSSMAKIQGARASLVRVLLALQRPIDPLMTTVPVEPLRLEGELRLEQVWFRYGEETDWVLRDLNLTIGAKTMVGFVGSTGSGKSTTADLILGLLQPQQGTIFVNGLPLKGERLRQWQQSIAHVPQSIFLSDGTVAENIAFGIPRTQIDFNQVRKAARLAQAENFIESLPAGYETYVGERGIRLSGGQRQRIGIARALYKNTSVIVFDEATSALDNTTEQEVMAAIDALSGEFTIILIAHRLSTVEQCDLVVELKQGQVVAQGKYRDLINYSTSFQQMAGVETTK
ncbi:MAG: ABC transporter ATP-binding protein [Cyanobacteria bacterium P01_D01_bin.156]